MLMLHADACSISSFFQLEMDRMLEMDILQIPHGRSDGGSMVHPERPDRCGVAATHEPGGADAHFASSHGGIQSTLRKQWVNQCLILDCKENPQEDGDFKDSNFYSRNSIADKSDKPCLYQ